MNKTLRSFKKPMIRFLEKRYGKKEAKVKFKLIVNQFNTWMKEEGDLGGRANTMASNIYICYAVCALYEQLDYKFSEDDFNEFFDDAIKGYSKFLSKIDFNKLEKKKIIMKIVYKVINNYKKKSDKYHGNKWQNTWKIKVNPDNREKGFAFTLLNCPLYDFCKKNNYLEILPYMCHSDQKLASIFKAHLYRHKIISRGDDECSYWYLGDKNIEAIEDKNSV